MSLYLLLLALQADTVTSPPPLKVRTVVPAQAQPEAAQRKAPARANPTIIYAPRTPVADAASPPAATSETAPETSTAEVAAPLAGLSPTARQRIAAERKLNTERVTAHRRELAAAQEAVKRALAADPFDMAALKAALENRDRVGAAYRDRLTAAVLDLLGDIDPAERVTVARAVIEGEMPSAPRAANKPAPSNPTPVGR